MQMNVTYINPFIESVDELFATMLNAKAQRGKVGVTGGAGNIREIMAIIGLSGAQRGMVAISFPTKTALNVVGRILGAEVRVVDESTCDGIAEVVNIVAGSAKAKLAGAEGKPMDLSLPTVLRGGDFTVEYPSQTVWLEVPFNSELGPFTLRVTLEDKPAQ